MKTWNELCGSKGVYQSSIIDISSNFDYYISNVILLYQENDGILDVEVRVSYDGGGNWGEWRNISVGSINGIFDGEGVQMTNTKFQYRIVMDMTDDIFGISPVFSQISVTLTGAFKIENTGDIVCLPEMWFKKFGGFGTMTLTNETTGQSIEFKDINNSETIYIDNQNKNIKTDLPLTYRYNNHNKQWFKLQDGDNIITGIGNYNLEVRHEFKVLQG